MGGRLAALCRQTQRKPDFRLPKASNLSTGRRIDRQHYTFIGEKIIVARVGAESRTSRLRKKAVFGLVLVAQPLLAVWFLLDLRKAHNQEWLCHSIFSAAC